MKAGRRHLIKNDDDSNNQTNAKEFQSDSSSMSDFSDSDDREKSQSKHRSNKSKLSTHIVPSFFDEIFREIDETQNIDQDEETIPKSSETIEIDSNTAGKYFNVDNNENQHFLSDNSLDLVTPSQNVSSCISDLNANNINNSNPSKSDFIPSITGNVSSKKSVATSPFKPTALKQQDQKRKSEEQSILFPLNDAQTISQDEMNSGNSVQIDIESKQLLKEEQSKKKSVTILYPKKSPQAQQRKQHEIQLLQRAKQQEQQSKAKKNQQLILVNEKQQVINQPSKSILKDTITNDTHNMKKKVNIQDNDSNIKPRIVQRKKADIKDKESKPTYVPPMYDKKLSSLFDIVSSESDEPFTHDHVLYETSQAELRDVFVFNIHEEGGLLYLFCKYYADETQYGTICICIASPSLFLQFLPSFDMSDENVEKEIDEIAKLCKGEIISKKWLTKKSINSTLEQRYLEVELPSKFNIADIPIKGKTYEAVFGSTLSLSENLMIRLNLKGAKWIGVRCAQSPCRQTSVPMYTTFNLSDIEITKDQLAKPSMNICIFSMFERNNEVFMISMRIFYQCNYETLDNYKGLNSSRKSIITFIYIPEISKTSAKNDRTTVYCSSETELLRNFAERIEQFDIDILCSYDLVEHDLPFILARMKANNIKQWTKLGRHTRNVFPKKDSLLQLITSGRMLLDLKSSFKNLLQIESDTFSSLVQAELEIDRPILNFDSGSFCFTDQRQMQELISFNRKDTQFIKKILENKNVIALSEHVSRVTGLQWSQIMSESPSPVIESLLLHYLHKKNYILPDKKQKSDKYQFEKFETKPGFYIKSTALISCNFFTAKVIQRKNLCFTSFNQVNLKKSNTIFPNMVSELLNTLKKLNQVEAETESSQASLYKKTLFADSINVVLKLIKPYFEYGSQRFPMSLLGQVVDSEIHKIINSFGDNIILVSSQNDFDSFIIEYSNYNDDQDNKNNENVYDEIDELISHANSGLKHFGFEVSEKYSRLLVLENEYASQETLLNRNLFSFLGINKDGDLIPYNFDFYRFDWCPATKILVDCAIQIVLKSNDAENELITLFKDFPDTTQLKPSDFAITTFPPSAQVISLIKIKNKKSQKLSKTATNRNTGILRRVNDDIGSDSVDDQDQSCYQFLSDDDYLEIENSYDVNEDNLNAKREMLDLNKQLYEITKKYEEKGKFINIEKKISYIHCLDNVIKSVESVDSIDGQIDIKWYKKNQFYDAMKLILKPFNIPISSQIFDILLDSEDDSSNCTENDANLVEFYNDNNNARIIFPCFNCNQKNIFDGISNECLKCQNCGIRFNCKFVANSLTLSINKLLEKWSKNEMKCDYFLCKQKREQLPICKFETHTDPCNPTKNCCGNYIFEYSPRETYDGLLALGDLFDKDDTTDEVNELKEYMWRYMSFIKEAHPFSNMKISSFFSTQSQLSDTQVVNDVCSFLDDE